MPDKNITVEQHEKLDQFFNDWKAAKIKNLKIDNDEASNDSLGESDHLLRYLREGSNTLELLDSISYDSLTDTMAMVNEAFAYYLKERSSAGLLPKEDIFKTFDNITTITNAIAAIIHNREFIGDLYDRYQGLYFSISKLQGRD